MQFFYQDEKRMIVLSTSSHAKQKRWFVDGIKITYWLLWIGKLATPYIPPIWFLLNLIFGGTAV